MAQTADQTLEAPQATTPAAAEPTQNQSIAVEIYDQIYHLSGQNAAHIRELAARVGMSRSIFALRFKETVGATPMEYLTRWRMLLAGDRLKNSGDSISVIASSLGYESETAFGKA